MKYLNKKADEWMTPIWYWKLIKDFIQDKVVWEPFYGSGQSCVDLAKYCSVHDTRNQDFFEATVPEGIDFVLSNPPYSTKIKIINRLEELGLNYILLLPAHFMFSQFWQKKCRTHPETYSMGLAPKRMGFIKPGRTKPSLAPFNCCFFFKGIDTPGHFFYL